MADVNLGPLAATTLRNHRKSIADNLTQHNAFLRRLDEKGNIKEVADGGRTIVEPLIYGVNASGQFYSDYDSFTPPTTQQDTVDASEWNWKQLGGFLSISGMEQIKNSGPARIVELVDARKKQLEAQLRNSAALSLYSDGTGSASKEFGGLKLIVADDPTTAGVVGGISQSANAFWRNYYSAAAATSSTTVTGRMNTAWLNVVRGKDRPDLLLSDDVMFGYYWASLQSLARFTESKKADAGFTTLRYMDAEMVFDDACNAKHMYFLNTDSLAFRYAPNRWFEVGDARQVVTADYTVIPIFVAGNLTCNARFLNGVVIAS